MKLIILISFLLSFILCTANENSKASAFKKAMTFVEKGQKYSASILFLKLIAQENEKGKGADISLRVGQFYRKTSLFNEANTYLKLALTYNDTNTNTILYNDIRNEIGLLYYDQHFYTNALAEFLLNIKLTTALHDTLGLAIAYINIGNIYKETENYDDALTYYESGIKYSQLMNQTYLSSIALNNLGSIYYLQAKPLKAITVFEQALTISETQIGLTDLAHIQINMGQCKVDLNEYAVAKTLFESSLKNYNKFKNTEGIFLCYINLYNVSNLLQLNTESNHYKELALDHSFKYCNVKSRIDLYTYLKNESFLKQDSTNALVYTLQLLELNKEMRENIKNRELATLKTDINFIHVNNQLNETIKNLQKETEAKTVLNTLNTNLTRQNKLILILSLLGILLLLSLVIILYRSNRLKHKNNIILEYQKKIVEEKNTEILNSITYATSMEKLLLQQMNPHFLYNALTTIEASISVGDIEFAKDYLILFSDLLRKTLDHSRKDVISLEEEIDFLKAYITLNTDKQGSQFSYEFVYNQDEVEDFVFTPPMLVQPFIENALIHGLYHKTHGEKKLTIHIQPGDNHIIWTITDNGVGREKAKKIGKTHQGISHGIKITVDRIHWMKKRYGSDFSIQYIDLAEGTKVILKTPILDLPS